MDLSIIIPIYNEEAKIAADITAAAQFLVDHNIEGEILVVDNASTDRSAEIAHETQVPASVTKKVIINSGQHGKGYAVRSGVKQSSGTNVMFADSGLCIPYNNILPAIELLKNNECEAAHGSRKLTTSLIKRRRVALRRVLSEVFRHVTFFVIGIPDHFTDTQCGFKIYDGNIAREVFEESITDGFLFDIDIMIRILKRGHRIMEFPVEWTPDPDSKVIPFKLVWPVIREIVAIKRDVAKKYPK